MSETKQAECRRNSWLVALAGGVLLALMLHFVAHYGAMRSLFIGLIFFVALGVILVWAFCSKIEATVAAPAPVVPPRVEPAPLATAEPETEAPAPVVVSEPEAQPEPETVMAPEPAAVMAETSVEPVAEVTEEPKAEPATKKPVAKKPAAKKSAAKKPAARKTPVAKAEGDTASGLGAAIEKSKTVTKVGSPELLAAPRDGKADDLKLINGIGPKLEALLNEVGVWHFSQIASWRARDVAFVDQKMVGFHGRITRDKWIKQAKELAKGTQS